MRSETLKPLHGLPVSIKDLEPSAGLRCTYGSKFFEHNIADFDGMVTARQSCRGHCTWQNQHVSLWVQGHVR